MTKQTNKTKSLALQRIVAKVCLFTGNTDRKYKSLNKLFIKDMKVKLYIREAFFSQSLTTR